MRGSRGRLAAGLALLLLLAGIAPPPAAACSPGSLPRGPLAAPAGLAAPGGPSRALAVLAAIERRGGDPLPGWVGGRVFENRERRLPPGRYREYDLHPRVPGRDRGPERLVVDQRSGRAYYTGDHYRTFVPLDRDPDR
jgi:ribonuclease T1